MLRNLLVKLGVMSPANTLSKSSTTTADMHLNMIKRVSELEKQLYQAQRALIKSGELVESLGNQSTACSIDENPFKTEIGCQIEALGEVIKLMAHEGAFDFPSTGYLAEQTKPALMVLQQHSQKFNELVKNNCKNDVESMLYLAEILYLEADTLASEAKNNTTTMSDQDKKNLGIMACAYTKIRSITYDQDQAQGIALLQIREIADRMHNAPAIMARGEKLDAEAMLNCEFSVINGY